MDMMQLELRVETIGGQADPQVLQFTSQEVTLGRSSDNDVVLAAPQVSGHHARICYRREADGTHGVFLVDLNSSNGTFVEGIRLEPQTEVPLRSGQRVVIGNFLLLALFEEEQVPRSAEIRRPEEPTGRHESAEYRVKRQIHSQLIDRLDLRRKDIVSLSDDELRSRARNVIEQILIDLRWELPEGLDREKLIGDILNEALGLGPLEELLADDDCSEIMVNRYDQIYAEMQGKLQLTALRFSSEQAVLAAIERILAPIGRRIDESSPMVDARLKDGSRVNAVIRPLALRGPCITIRKFSRQPILISDLVRFRSVTHGMAEFMRLAVESRLNIVISGGTGSGKTTLLNVMSSFIPHEQRVITVEDAAELQLSQEHVVSFETRPPNLEGKGAITIRDLVRNALRMRPDRIIVGECRGGEALDMLQAMNTGHDGSMTTGHSNSPTDMIRRLETMVLTAGLDLPVRAIREQIASAVHLIVQQTRFSCGTRKVTAISEVVGMDYDEGVVMLQDVFVFRQDGYGADGKIKGRHQATGYIPKFFRALQERGLPVDARVFSPDSADI